MLFAASLENSHILLGVFSEDNLLFQAQIATDKEKTADEYAILLQGILSMHQINRQAFSGAILASVVRPLTDTFGQAMTKLIGISPLILGPGVKTGLNIRTDIPSQVGADLVALAVAAQHIAKAPLIIISFGTATTLTGLKSEGELSGVLIYPGVRASLNALSSQAADLPSVALDMPKSILGKNTIDSMVNGIVHGSAAMIDGILERIEQEWQTPELTVMTTGPFADKIIPHCRTRHQLHHEPNLTLLGLRQIYRQNTRPK